MLLLLYTIPNNKIYKSIYYLSDSIKVLSDGTIIFFLYLDYSQKFIHSIKSDKKLRLVTFEILQVYYLVE